MFLKYNGEINIILGSIETIYGNIDNNSIRYHLNILDPKIILVDA